MIQRWSRRSRAAIGRLSLLLVAVGISALLVPAPGIRAVHTAAQPGPTVIAQGVAPLPTVPIAWRVVTPLARPVVEAPLAERSLGFLLADEDPVEVSFGGSGVDRLDPGEARLVAQGEIHQRASTGPFPVPYYALELVVEADLRVPYSLGSAPLRYAGPAFSAPPGRQDLVLFRYALAAGERLRLTDLAAPALAVVTGGEVEIGPVGAATRTLVAGEAGSFAYPFWLTALGGPATVVVALIRPATIPPPPAATGSISLTPYACPIGMRPETLDPGACSPAPDVMDLQTFVLSSGANRRTLADATVSNGVFTWEGLPFGEYVIQATELAPGYDRYLIPGLGGLNAGTAPPERGYTVSPNEGHLLPLGPAAPRPDLAVFAFRAATTPGPASLGLFLHACPPGVAAPDLRPAGCTPIDPLAVGFDVRLDADELPRPLTLADAVPADAGGYRWAGLPYANYIVSVTLPPGYDGYALRSYRPDFPVTLLPDRTGYAFTLRDGLFAPGALRRVNIDAYLLTE